MKASLQWMKDYVSVNIGENPQEFADALTQAGIPVEEVINCDTGIKKIYTGKIVEITKHPDADKLQVCQVECLTEEGEPVTKQIVTAATNVAVGQIVPVAYHKSRLADGTEIKKGKLRGEVSEGMFCSVAEFGLSTDVVLPEEATGIYIFPEGTAIGQDVKEVLGLTDVVYEFELTPNRADCFSMVGLSREFAVLGKSEATFPKVTVQEEGASIEGRLNISIEDTELCSRFMGRLIENVTVQKSPLWLQNRLRNCGIRPINNVVDVTNYVMLELGQPMHAYDYNHLHGHSLVARKATAGEVIQTLDSNDRTLADTMLVIADADRPVGVAGVMGGADSEVSTETTTVVLEAAVFNGASIRRTSRALGLRSEASGRFERGVNSEMTPLALDRAAQLLLDITPGATVAKGVIDVYAAPKEVRTVSFTSAAVNAYLGTAIDEAEMVNILTTLSFTVEQEGDVLVATIPSWRDDVTDMPDIAEEVARIHNYDEIQPTMPLARIQTGTVSPMHALVHDVKHSLAGAGLDEIITFSFMHKDSLQDLLIPETDSRHQAIPILNPISEEFPVMRTTLVPSVLETAKRNVAQKNLDLALFEVAAVYEPKALPLTELPKERMMAAGVILGKWDRQEWNVPARNVDFYDVKGIIESVLAGLGIDEYGIARSKEHYLHPGISASITVDGVEIVRFGELHPQVASHYDVNGKAYLFEMDLEAMLQVNKKGISFTGISKFPGTSRDLAIVAPNTVQAGDILAVMQEEGGEYLESVRIFDVYEGEHIQDGYRSLAYTLSFRSHEGTLVDADIEDKIQGILAKLADKGCTLR